MNPPISIIVPIFNVESYLDQCLTSICEQSLCNIEIICVNDGSTDNSPAIINRFAKNDRRILVLSKQNSGYGDSVNQGIKASRGEYIGIVEPDDWIDSDMYKTLYEASLDQHKPDIVKGAYWRVINPGKTNQAFLPANYLGAIPFTDKTFTLDENAELLFHHPSIWTAIYKRDFLDAFGIRFQKIPGAGWADNPFLIESLVQARSILYVDKPLYFYREFNDGSSSNVKDPSIIFQRWLEMDGVLKDLKISSPTILEGHYNRGCAYIEMLEHDFKENSAAQEGIREMVLRIDYQAVLNSNKIPQEYKDAYQKHVPRIKRLAYRLRSITGNGA